MANRILIVEDDEPLRRLYRTALQLSGFDVQEASDGLGALRRIDFEPPDLVVLDLTLPILSGFAVQQEIAACAHTSHIPIVVVTGSAEPLELPCVLRKPVTAERLVETVRACLAAAGFQGVRGS